MTCVSCHREFEGNEKIVANLKTTFVFKPATVQDTVNPAKATPRELLESRLAHTKTEISTVYVDYGDASMPEGAFNIRHATCGAPLIGSNPLVKHMIRYSRSQIKRGAQR